MVANSQVAKAAGFLMITATASRLLGYLRDVIIYANFGQNRLTDAYNAAFSVPDFLYMLLVGGALSSAFIPVFTGYLTRNQEEEAWEVASIVFNWIIALMLVGIAIGLTYTPQLISLLVPGFPPESLGLTIKMTRIMFAQVFFMVCSGIAMGILNSYKHFKAPAIGSILYNLGIIVVGYLLSTRYGITGFAIGVVVGALLQFGVQLPVLIIKGMKYRISFNLRHPGVLRLLGLMGPILIGLSVMQVNLFVNQHLASNLAGGTVAALRTSQRLMQLPIGIFATAISVAFFPTLTEYATKGDQLAFRQATSAGLRTIIFLALPATIGLVVLRVPLIRLLLQVGKFTAENTETTAYALLFYSLGICGYASIQLLSRSFYALQNTLIPVVVGVFTIMINLVLNFALVGPLAHGGLALAYSLAGSFNGLALLFLLRRKLGSIDGWHLLTSFSKSLVASLLMGVVLYFFALGGEDWFDVTTKGGQLIQVSMAMLIGLLLYGGMASLLRIEEAEVVWSLLRKKRFT